MDYLDTKKELEHRIILLVGYILVAIAIVIAALILLYQAYGYGLSKNGTVIQNSFAFVSSQPHPAQVTINGKPEKSTNTRLTLPGGTYQLKLSRPGYRSWQNTIQLNGGEVRHYDYPVLFPTKLTTTPLQSYASEPGLATQSPDRRWLIVEQPGSLTTFDVYDLKATTKTMTTITLPANLLTKATISESLQFSEWADDNQHVVLQHDYDGKTEYILLDRVNPDQSINLSTTLSANPTKLTLNNKKYDQYYLYNATTQTLEMATKSSTPTPLLQHVLAYQSYGNNEVLYATDSGAPTGKVLVKLAIGNQTYNVHTFTAGSTYLLDLTQYNGTLYVAAGASGENKVYIYSDPVGQLNGAPDQAVSPVQILHVADPTYLSFSDNAQFIMTESGAHFGVYDIQNKLGYNYSVSLPLDAPATHATWMDGDRLTYVSGGKLVVLDYDDTNQQVLMPASSSFLPAFSSDYNYVYVLTPSAATAGQFNLTQTALLTPGDL